MAERPMPTSDAYPNNSDKARAKAQNKPEKLEKVTKGMVIQKKKSFGRRFAEAFGAREGQGVLDYILYDIVIPATRNMVFDSIQNGAEMLIFGEIRGRRYGRGYSDNGRGYRYDRVSYRDDDRRGYGRDRRDDDDRYGRRVPNGVNDYEDLLFASQYDAETVISKLIDLIDAYNQATISDLYDLAGQTAPDYACGNYGWRNLSTARSKRVRDGYILDLPRPIVL